MQKEYGYRGGELLVIATNSAEVHWLVSDHLGTPRMIVDKTGMLSGVKRHDYLPFGEELSAGTGGRTTAQGYVGDNVRQQYTKYERDNETGLDYAKARYFSSVQGRFTSLDASGPNLLNPQTLNKYRYALNNPLRYTDPDGLYERDVHFSLTVALSIAAGFSADMAIGIGRANIAMDSNFSTNPLVPWNFSARRKYHFPSEVQVGRLWGKFEGSPSIKSLGTYLHAMQDSYSHAGFNFIIGHIFKGSGPDKTAEKVGEADIMAERTYNDLVSALDVFASKGLAVKSPAVEFKDIKKLVTAFNQAEGDKAKSLALTTLIRRISGANADEVIQKVNQALADWGTVRDPVNKAIENSYKMYGDGGEFSNTEMQEAEAKYVHTYR